MKKFFVPLLGLLLGLPLFASAAPLNEGVAQVDHPEAYSRIFAISDNHGMHGNLVRLLATAGIVTKDSHGSVIWSAGNSLVLVVGDSIDKGPKSVEVFDLWLSLALQAKQAGGRVIHLLGNHEALFLADPNNEFAQSFNAELQQRGIPQSEFTGTGSARGSAIHLEPAAARVGRWLFCHAGFAPQMPWADFVAKAQQTLRAGNYGDPFLTGNDSLLMAKDWWGDSRRATLLKTLDSWSLSGLVFGHQPEAMNIIGAIGLGAEHRVIKIDTGMAPEAGSHKGGILVFLHPTQLNGSGLPDVAQIQSGNPSLEPLVQEAIMSPQMRRPHSAVQAATPHHE